MQTQSCGYCECGKSSLGESISLLLMYQPVLVSRPGTSDFIAQQMQIMTQLQVEQERRAHELEVRRLQRPRSRIGQDIPPVPALPS